MADRQTLLEYISKADLPSRTKASLRARVARWKTDRQVADYLFRMRNMIQENPKIRNKKAFRAYQPKEVYVELKIYREVGNEEGRNVYAFTHKYNGTWVEEDNVKFGFTGSDHLRNIIVPKWFMDRVKTETKTIYKKGRLESHGFGRLTEDVPQGTGTFVQGVQTFNDGNTFLEQLQDVCRQSDEIASIELNLTRSAQATDSMVQIVSVRDLPEQNRRAVPIYQRPLRAWGNVEPLLTHKVLLNDDYNPQYNLSFACVLNAVLNTWAIKDQKRVGKPKTSNRGRPRAPEMSYKYLFSIAHFGQPYPGDDKLPPVTLTDLDKILRAMNRRARAYDVFEREVWRSSNYKCVDKKHEILCLLIKDEHAYTIKDSHIKSWLERSERDERSNSTYSAKASYMLTDKPPREFVGVANTLEKVKELVTASVPSKNDIHILWTGEEDFNTVCPQLIRDYEYQPDITQGTGGRISQLKLRFQGTDVFLHLVPFGVTVESPEFVEAERRDTNPDKKEYVKELVTLAELNKALLLQHNLRKCLTPELRSEYAPNFMETLVKYRCAPPRIAFQDFDPDGLYDVVDYSKSYPSILRDAKVFARFSRFDRFLPYDGHRPRHNNLYIWKKRANAPDDPAFQVQFKDRDGVKYGRFLLDWMQYLDIESYAEPYNIVRNPFQQALKAIFDSDLPSILKKLPTNFAIGEFGKWRTHWKKVMLSVTHEDGSYNQERLGGILLQTPGDLYTLVTYEERLLKDGFLPIQQYIYDEQMYRVATLIREVGEDNAIAVNVDGVYLKPGTVVEYQKVDTNTYKNLGRVQVEEKPKRIRARILPSNKVPPVVNHDRLYASKTREAIPLEQVPQPTVIQRIGQERVFGIFDDVLQSHRLVLVKSPMPGSGKTWLVLDYIKRMCAQLQCAIACPTNYQARSIRKDAPDAVCQTLYELTGKIATKEHLWGRKTSKYDVVILEEIGQWSTVHWSMFCDYAERNPKTKFIATGDTKQIVPIEHNWNGDAAHKMGYFDRIFNEVFPVHIELMEPKRFKPEHIPLVYDMYKNFWELKLSIAQLCDMYGNKGKRPKKAIHVTFRNDVADFVNRKVHGKQPEYFEGLTLVKTTCCKEGDKIKRGFEVKIARIQDNHVWFEDQCEKYTLDFVGDNFEYAYAYTGHKLQGRSFDIPVRIYDSDFEYADRNWLWVALTRARDPTQVYIEKTPTNNQLNKHFALKKMRQYARDDATKGRECDLLDYGEQVALQKLIELLKEQNYRCYDPLGEGCDRVLTLGSSKKKFQSDLTFDRVNNDYGHLWFSCDNIKLCCEQCNIRRKNNPIVA
jgi:AAA domain